MAILWRILGLSFIFLIPSVYTQDYLSKNIYNNLNDVLKDSENQVEVTPLYLRSTLNYNNETCNLQIQDLFEGFSTPETWALEVVDSWGKIPSGLLRLNYRDLGNFDECINVYKNVGNVSKIPFKGQYCLAEVGVEGLNIPMSFDGRNFQGDLTNDVNSRMMIAPGTIGVQIGVCIPNSCSPEYFLDLIEEMQNSSTIPNISNFTLKFVDMINCQQKEDVVFNAGDIFTICFFAFVGFLLIGSTLYDVILTYNDKPKNTNLLAFSIYTNGEKLFKCNRSKSSNVLDCLNGIRVLSIIWVVYGHSYMMSVLSPNINFADLFDWTKTVHSQLLVGATVSVDSFFLMSGLLVTWSMLRHLDQNKGRINIFLLYFHRYLRLTPTFAIAILFYATLYRFIGSGPMWKNEGDVYCQKWWWSALLYVQNYVNPGETCVGQSWYLSVDMQLFILSPFFIYPLWRWRHKFTPVIILVIFISMACTFSLFMVYELKAGFTHGGDNTERMHKTYFVTHTRMGVWFLGVLLGYILHNLKGKTVVLNKLIITICWTISIGTILAVVFGGYNLNQFDTDTTTLESAFHETFTRISWGISLSWIIFACVHGYGGPINWFLSWPQWQPVARLSYSIYILHMQIQVWFSNSARTLGYFNDRNAIYNFWGDFGYTITVAILWTLAFESPIITLEKLILGGCGSHKSKKQSKEHFIENGQEKLKINHITLENGHGNNENGTANGYSAQ